jgi:hypothetical protein
MMQRWKQISHKRYQATGGTHGGDETEHKAGGDKEVCVHSLSILFFVVEQHATLQEHR